MGYRSEVGIKCQENAYKMFMDAARQHDFTPDRILKNSNNEYTLIWDWTKWYETFPEVNAIIYVMYDLDELHDVGSEDGLGYSFIRLGEDEDDTEYKGNDYDIQFYIVRQIYTSSDDVPVEIPTN